MKWARSDKMRDQKWDLIVMHFDRETNILYVGYSEKRLDIDYLVEAITQEKPMPIKGDCVFRSFNAIKRLSIVHAGIFKPANHLHRYSRLSGADVTTELTKWKEGKRCQNPILLVLDLEMVSPSVLVPQLKVKSGVQLD